MNAPVHSKGNPFPLFNKHQQIMGWSWHDETYSYDRIYQTQRQAMEAMLIYVARTATPSWHQRLRSFLIRLWRDESTLPRR